MPTLIAAVICSVGLCSSVLSQTSLTKASSRSLTIITEPSSTIWLDGIQYGATDDSGRLVINWVPPGAHTLKIRARGFKQLTKVVPATTKGETAAPLIKTSDPAEVAFQEAESLRSVDRGKAAEAFLSAIKLNPKNIDAFIGLARTYAEAGEYEKALTAIRNGRRLNPASAELSVIEGRVQKDSGSEERAIAAFNRSLKEGRGFQPEAYTGLGLLYKDRAETAGGSGDYDLENEDYTLAAKDLAAAAKQLGGSPDAMVVYQLLGLIYEKQKKYSAAIGTYEEFLAIFPDTGEASAVRSFIDQIKKQMQSKN